MFIFNFLADLVSSRSFSGNISEPAAVLFFGIAIFGVTAGLRSFFNKQDKNAEEMLGKMNEAICITES